MNTYHGEEQELDKIKPLTKKQEKEVERVFQDFERGNLKMKGFPKKK